MDRRQFNKIALFSTASIFLNQNTMIFASERQNYILNHFDDSSFSGDYLILEHYISDFHISHEESIDVIEASISFIDRARRQFDPQITINEHDTLAPEGPAFSQGRIEPQLYLSEINPHELAVNRAIQRPLKWALEFYISSKFKVFASSRFGSEAKRVRTYVRLLTLKGSTMSTTSGSQAEGDVANIEIPKTNNQQYESTQLLNEHEPIEFDIHEPDLDHQEVYDDVWDNPDNTA
jgi:hypothetical protein